MLPLLLNSNSPQASQLLMAMPHFLFLQPSQKCDVWGIVPFLHQNIWQFPSCSVQVLSLSKSKTTRGGKIKQNVCFVDTDFCLLQIISVNVTSRTSKYLEYTNVFLEERVFNNIHHSQVSREYLYGYKQNQIQNQRLSVLDCETESF